MLTKIKNLFKRKPATKYITNLCNTELYDIYKPNTYPENLYPEN